MPVEIPLNRGFVTLVDEADAERVLQFTWTWTSRGYVYGWIHSRRFALHRWLLDPPPHLVVDHIDGDGLNNQRANMRICTNKQNLSNQGPSTRNTIGLKGVRRLGNGRFIAQITANGRTRGLGTFDAAEDAARAYDAAALRAFGEFARPNFPSHIFFQTNIALPDFSGGPDVPP